jgi:hypothetical protein
MSSGAKWDGVDRRAEDSLIREFELVGIDITTSEGRKEFRKDIEWAHNNRKRCEKIVGWSIIVILGGCASVIGNIFLNGLPGWLKGLNGGQ